MSNERITDWKLKRQLDHIDAEISKVYLMIEIVRNVPTPYGLVYVKNEKGDLVHPIIASLEKKIQELMQKREKLFPTYSSFEKKESFLNTTYR